MTACKRFQQQRLIKISLPTTRPESPTENATNTNHLLPNTKPTILVKPVINIETDDNAKPHQQHQVSSNDESFRISSSSYSTASSRLNSTNKMFTISSESNEELPTTNNCEDPVRAYTKRLAKLSVNKCMRKSNSFSFERVPIEPTDGSNEDIYVKKRNFSYFATKLKFSLEMDILKKFSITNEKDLIEIKTQKFRVNPNKKVNNEAPSSHLKKSENAENTLKK